MSRFTYPSSTRPRSDPSPKAFPESSLLLPNISYSQDEYPHPGSARIAVAEQTATMSDTYIYNGRETREWWAVRNLFGSVSSVIPDPFQLRQRQGPPSTNMAEPGSSSTERPQLPARPPVSPGPSSESAWDMGPIPPPPNRQARQARQAHSSKRAVKAAFDGAKWFSAVISSLAMELELELESELDPPSNQTSGVDWKFASQGLAPVALASSGTRN